MFFPGHAAVQVYYLLARKLVVDTDLVGKTQASIYLTGYFYGHMLVRRSIRLVIIYSKLRHRIFHTGEEFGPAFGDEAS